MRRVGSVQADPKEATVYNLTLDGLPAFDTLIGASHNTQKPVTLAGRAMANSTMPGDLVVDAYAGSGSTMIAGEMNRRAVYAMEQDNAHCDAIVQRFLETFEDSVATRNGQPLSLQELLGGGEE